VKFVALAAGTFAVLLAAFVGITAAWPADGAVAQAPGDPGLAASLRHVGRDHLTGLPTRVGEAFIVEQQVARERYGRDEREPIPPPPVAGTDIVGLTVEAINVQASTGRYGVDRFGRLDVPQDAATIGWHPAYSALPGSGGATFLAAHYEYSGRAGIFHELSDLRPGDTIAVHLSDGTVERYVVSSAVDYELGVIDMGALLHGREGMESLTLMTCSGRFVDGTYDYRTVVLAEKATPSPA
jgi:hypothetical protein